MFLARDPEQPRCAVRRTEIVTDAVPFNSGDVYSTLRKAPQGRAAEPAETNNDDVLLHGLHSRRPYLRGATCPFAGRRTSRSTVIANARKLFHSLVFLLSKSSRSTISARGCEDRRMARPPSSFVFGAAAFSAAFGLLVWLLRRRQGDPFLRLNLLLGIPGVYLAGLASWGEPTWLFVPGLTLMAGPSSFSS
jgi:hypothetical protein